MEGLQASCGGPVSMGREPNPDDKLPGVLEGNHRRFMKLFGFGSNGYTTC